MKTYRGNGRGITPIELRAVFTPRLPAQVTTEPMGSTP
jgi:hypothetical protein